jgi:hypothetical protein
MSLVIKEPGTDGIIQDIFAKKMAKNGEIWRKIVENRRKL